MLPPICTSRPASRRMWATSAVVVDLPLVPVMATNGASGASFARSRQNSSMSPMISTPAAFASLADQCGSGWVSGTPGERISAAKRDQSAVRRSAVSIPCACAFAIASALSSQATTRAPPLFSASAVASPEPPSPNSATVRPAKVVAGVMRCNRWRSPRSPHPEVRAQRASKDAPWQGGAQPPLRASRLVADAPRTSA